MKRPLNERKENVWKGRKATRALDCRVFLSFCMGDAFSTNGQWLHWIVLEGEREGKIKLVCGGRKKNMMGKKKKEERLREIARGGRRRLLSSESRWIVSIHRRLAVLSTVESSL